MPGKWSQIRLYKEAKLDNELQRQRWCMSRGLVRDQQLCRTHRRACAIVEREGSLQLYCSRCNKWISCARSSILEDSCLSTGKVVMLAYSYAYMYSYKLARRACVFSDEDEEPSDATVARWYEIFRDRLIDVAPNLTDAEGPIGGPGMIVQVDEALIGRRKYNRGRVVPGTWVLGMIDSSGKLRLEVCADRTAATLSEIIQRNVHQGSIIHTDGWRAYRGLSELGYEHRTVNHSVEFVADDGTHTQAIESQWRALRRRFSPGGTRQEDIGDRLVEYIWRRRCELNRLDPFEELLEIIKA